jgi:uncharacterized OsmC-like protein
LPEYFLGNQGVCKSITVNVRVTGNLSGEQKQEVVRLGSQFSPVYDMVTNSVPVTVKLSS